MSEFKELESLLRLKRYETPPEGYFEQFAENFKDRQRSEMLRQSARGLFVERVSTYFWGVPSRNWMMAGGVATALLATGYWLLPDAESPAAAPEEISADPSTQGAATAPAETRSEPTTP